VTDTTIERAVSGQIETEMSSDEYAQMYRRLLLRGWGEGAAAAPDAADAAAASAVDLTLARDKVRARTLRQRQRRQGLQRLALEHEIMAYYRTM
jgi:hypothetical protein